MLVSNPFDDRATALRAKIVALFTALLLVNVAAWLAAVIVFAGNPILLGTAVLAYALGLRHAFDADHLAAIDNVVRKLVQEGKRPLSTGFFFSLGHSSVVVLVSLCIAAMAATMPETLESLRGIAGPFGTIVSATFLLGIGAANLLVLRKLWRMVGRGLEARSTGSMDDASAGRGGLTRLLGPLLGLVSRSWHLYPIGFLFGLGFDTATEIGLVGLSATEAAQGLSLWHIMLFPALFTAGMTLADTADSVLMTGAYGWAFVQPERKLWYNIMITALSVTVAFLLGGAELLGLVHREHAVDASIASLARIVGGGLGPIGTAVVVLGLASAVGLLLVRRRRDETRIACPAPAFPSDTVSPSAEKMR